MNVLALNCGSSSVKFRLLAVTAGAPAADARALAERTEAVRAGDYGGVIERVLRTARAAGPVDAVGHRVVHGGPRFVAPTRIDAEVLAAIEALESLAPLHNRPSLAGIRACRAALGEATPQVAVFDTAFHARLPERAARYAIPPALAERHGVRRYGFHGISYAWATARAAARLGRPVSALKLVALHLGNGCSAAAIRDGVSIDTSMGLTPLEGLVMGTRSGDVDPALPGALARAERVSVEEIEHLLNERSGLLGLGGSADPRELLVREATDAGARLALDVFCYRARKYLGAYLAALRGADAVVFTGGIGEHQAEVRARIATGFEWCGLVLDPARNAAAVGVEAIVSADGAPLRALVVPADEERM
ncbi:MAG TPA: acetate/propionate family kinase, partial [Methylomirabilota bacterium]|nr:acetate/propionate family kinase [Methylomirabilota bacterium]